MSVIYDIQNLSVQYFLGKSSFLALREVSLKGYEHETLGLVGESGSGKSTLAKALMCLQAPSQGKILFEGRDLTDLANKEKRLMRQKMQMIFQDPDASLNPRMTIQEHLREAILCSKVDHSGSIDEYIHSLMSMVQLSTDLLDRYSHQLSGGQKQRVSIARALSVKPKLLICDEPLSSLDISVVSQIILLLKKLQQEQGLTYLFITHDLATLSYLADRLAVLYLGKIMEIGPKEAIFTKPLHPYTQGLMSAVPVPDPSKEKSPFKILTGDPPSLINPPQGCLFHTRCPFASEICRTVAPELKEIKSGHSAACHLLT